MEEEVEVNEEEVAEVTTGEGQDTVQYEIIDGDIDGVKIRGVRANGNVLFTVSEGFDDEQIKEVFNHSNKFFNDGMRFGVGQTQAQLHQALGITPELIKALYDAAVAREAGQTDEEVPDQEAEAA